MFGCHISAVTFLPFTYPCCSFHLVFDHLTHLALPLSPISPLPLEAPYLVSLTAGFLFVYLFFVVASSFSLDSWHPPIWGFFFLCPMLNRESLAGKGWWPPCINITLLFFFKSKMASYPVGPQFRTVSRVLPGPSLSAFSFVSLPKRLGGRDDTVGEYIWVVNSLCCVRSITSALGLGQRKGMIVPPGNVTRTW